jgi:hypothetical protein
MDPLQILQVVVSTLEKLGVPSMIVGSFASSSHGFPRLTQDLDLVAQLNRNQVEGFIAAFSPDFYLDQGLIEQAVTDQTSFNIIHLESSFKVDIFPLPRGGYVEEEFSRRVLKQIDPRTDFAAYVQSAEDALLSKLDWYHRGGEVSENQWRDVIGILRIQGGRLDVEYLEKWAEELGISDLLLQARQEVALNP